MKVQQDRLVYLFASIIDVVGNFKCVRHSSDYRKTRTTSTAAVSRYCGPIAMEFHLMTVNRCVKLPQQSERGTAAPYIAQKTRPVVVDKVISKSIVVFSRSNFVLLRVLTLNWKLHDVLTQITKPLAAACAHD